MYFAGVLFLGATLRSDAQPVYTLTDQNSTAQIDVSSSSGMFHWDADGQNQLVQQWFWFRVDGGVNYEQPINAIAPYNASQPDNRTLQTTYFNGSYGVQIGYLLTGSAPGSGQSDIQETILITNATASPLVMHFFQYSDFDLGDPGNDTVKLGKNLRGLFNEASQSDPNVALTETVVTPGANRGEAAFVPDTVNKLNDLNPDQLNNNMTAGPGDVTWALEWDLTINPFSTVGISKDKRLQILNIPEPTTFALGALGILGFVMRKRRAS